MRRLFPFSQPGLAVLAGTAIAALTTAQAHAQYPGYPPYPGYPMVAPVMYVPAPVPPRPVVMPVTALTGDYRNWGWGKSRDCSPPCAAPEMAPAPAPQPVPPPDMKPVPEPIRPQPAPVQPPVVLQPTEPEQGPALGSGSYAIATPNMIGDFPGFSVVSHLQVMAQASGIATVPSGTAPPFIVVQVNGQVPASVLLSIPEVCRGPFKIAENESPRPHDRIFAYYNYYRIQADILNVQSTALPGAGSVGHTPVNFDLHRETIGFEKTFANGNASIGVRLPFFQTTGSPVFSTQVATPFAPNQNTGGSDVALTGALDLGDSDIGDISVVLKYALLNNSSNGNVLSVGLVVTPPTGANCADDAEGNVHSTLIQPWVGGIWYASRNLFLHGFSSIIVPFSSDEVLFWANDLGLGYWMYQGGTGRLQGIVPTLELHVNTPLTHQGIDSTPTGLAHEIILTGGVNLLLGNSAMLTLGAGTPLTGPQPYDIEGVVQFNLRF